MKINLRDVDLHIALFEFFAQSFPEARFWIGIVVEIV
jgi:hypothetical protein